jgi:TATA-binding protein-associated factor Taf7
MDLKLLINDAALPRSSHGSGLGSSERRDAANQFDDEEELPHLTTNAPNSEVQRADELQQAQTHEEQEMDDDEEDDEEEEEEGVFEIEDYSVVTEWERFIASVEEKLRSWLRHPPVATNPLQHAQVRTSTQRRHR